MDDEQYGTDYISGHKALEILEGHGWVPTGIMNGDVKQFEFTGRCPAGLKDWRIYLKITKTMPVKNFIDSLFAGIYPFYEVSGELQERKRIGKTLQDILDYAKMEVTK